MTNLSLVNSLHGQLSANKFKDLNFLKKIKKER